MRHATHTNIRHTYELQGGEDPYDALSCRSFSAKRAINYRALLRKMTYKDKESYDCTALSSQIRYRKMCACVTPMSNGNETCHIYRTYLILMCHDSFLKEACQTKKKVKEKSSDGTHMHESWGT